MNKVLITGGTGLIGQQLQQQLTDKNYEVAILTRNPKEKHHYKWDLQQNHIDEQVFENLDYIIHLAGAGVADKKWTPSRKKELIDSRVDSANLLFEKIKTLNIPLKKFISSSGIGFYGAKTSDKIYTEEDKPADDFIAEICIKWENAIHQFDALNIPTAILRTGVVLSKKGGALKKMNTPLFLSAIGSGKQYIPWIHIDDICNLYVEAVENENLIGIFNGSAPEHHTSKSFMQTLGKTIKKPVTPFNVPSFVLKLGFGELADILLEGSRVSTEKVEKVYDFKYPNLTDALKNIYTNV